jgi:hypothetical protein
MKKDNAIVLARSLMTKHGVGYLQFGFHDVFAAGPYAIGRCQFAQAGPIHVASKITLSEDWVEVLNTAEVTEIILHEIAHAKSPYMTDHGPRWQDECIKLGIEPRVKFKSNNVPDYIKTWQLVESA